MNTKFVIENKELIIPEEREKYNEVRKSYAIYSEYLIDEFYEIYMKENKNLKDVYENVLAQGDDRILEMAEITCDYLKEDGSIDLTGEELFENYRKTDRYSVWENQVEDIKHKYLELEYGKEYVEDLEKSKKERVSEEKDGESPSMNILKGVFDFIGDTVGRGVAYFEKTSLYKDENTIKSLMGALYFTCFSMHYDYINILEKNKGRKIYSYVGMDDERDADELFDKIKDVKMDREDIISTFIEMVKLNPYKDEYYKFIFKEFGDGNGDLERLASYFGVDIRPYKLERLSEHYREYRLEIMKDKERRPDREGFFFKLLNDDESLRQEGYIWKPLRIELIELIRLYLIKINLINYSKLINLDVSNSILEEVEDEIGEYRNRFNMVNGMEVDNFQAALSAKMDRESIENLIGDINLGSIDEVKESMDLIDLVIESEVKDLYLEELDEKLKKLTDQEIESLIKESKTTTIKNLENLIEYISSKYSEEESEKHIKGLENKITYLKTKDKVSETYGEVVDKGKKFFKKFFD